jgi:two-component system OmpR family sensor kinase
VPARQLQVNGGRPVAKLVAPVLVRVGAFVALMAAIAIAGVVFSTISVNHLTDDLEPAASANQDILQDLTDMNAAVSAWSQGGHQSAVDDYRRALSRLSGHEEQVREFARGDTGLELLAGRQEEASQAWLDQYAEPTIAVAGGAGSFRPQNFRLGQKRFDETREAHQATQEALDRRVREASTDMSYRFKGTILGVLALAIVAWVAVGAARRRLLKELSDPLLRLESVVQRMARNEPGVRAEARGPKEVRAVAVALNEFAESRGRARAVEGRIQNELRALDTAKDDFVSNVSHELRTPLTTISGYLEMVADEFDGRMAPRHERVLEATRRNVTRLKELIDDLLALSNAETRPSEPEPVDVAAIVRDALTDVRLTASRRGIRIELVAPDRTLHVVGDRAMLHRAFLNVLSNAVKFSTDQGTIEIALTRQLQQVIVAVTDHGIGIPAAELDRLGTRFFRATNAVTNEIAGTGLGLRIVQTIVDKHGGDVLIESTERSGTTVSIRLRLQDDECPPTSAEPHSVGVP